MANCGACDLGLPHVCQHRDYTGRITTKPVTFVDYVPLMEKTGQPIGRHRKTGQEKYRMQKTGQKISSLIDVALFIALNFLIGSISGLVGFIFYGAVTHSDFSLITMLALSAVVGIINVLLACVINKVEH